MADDVWVYADFHDTKNLGLMNKAQSLSRMCGGHAAAACTTTPPDIDLLIQCGADIIYHLPVQGSEFTRAQALCALCRVYRPGILLFPASTENNAVAAHTAAWLHTGLTAGCTGLDIENGGLLRQTRPAFGGGLIADICCKEKRPQMATIRPGVFQIPIPDKQRVGKQITFTPPALPPYPAELLLHELIPVKKDLQKAHIVIAGGKGVGSREGFKLLATLAERMDGLLGASRSAVDAGYADYDCQIGQTGMAVSPDLYMAFGISGAPQHIAGMNTSGKVIAVNNDSKAPIFDYADLAIIGDWRETAQYILDAYSY